MALVVRPSPLAKRPCVADFAIDGGPCLVAFISKPGGRHSDSCAGSTAASKLLLERLKSAGVAEDPGSAALLDAVGLGPCVVGIGVMRSWRFVCRDFESADAHRLANAAVGAHRKRDGAQFLEHAVLASAILDPEATR